MSVHEINYKHMLEDIIVHILFDLINNQIHGIPFLQFFSSNEHVFMQFKNYYYIFIYTLTQLLLDYLLTTAYLSLLTENLIHLIILTYITINDDIRINYY